MNTTGFSKNMNMADNLLLEYGQEVRPLLLDIVSRIPDRQLPIHLTNEIRAINNHIARCFIEEKSDEQIIKELGKAEGHLTRLEYDVYKQMNMFLYDKTIGEIERNGYEQMYGWYDSRWKSFRDQYYILKRETAGFVNKAKLAESSGQDKSSVLSLYKQGFGKYRDLENLMIKQDFSSLKRKNMRHKVGLIAKKAVMTILVFLITTVIIHYGKVFYTLLEERMS